MKPLDIATIILAAGRGVRMGERPKLLLPLSDGKPIIWHTARNALSLGASEVIVITRADLPEIEAAMSGLQVRCVPNPFYLQGMATSLAAGINALCNDVEAALVMLGDEPYVNTRIIKTLISAYRRKRKPITMPLYGDQPGPPTLFDRVVFPELLMLHGDSGGRQLAENHPDWVCFVPFDKHMRPQDVDTPDDYQVLL